MNIEDYKTLFLTYLSEDSSVKEPHNLYEPINYILNLGGKRLRPIMVLMGCDLLGGKIEHALDAALAMEMFHNFSLIHDDIMDKAPIRRGKPTVHKKWNLNTGILSGDAMLILANTLFNGYTDKTYKDLQLLFNTTALQVCEGQQYDIDFETKKIVSLKSYVKMITFKTAVLLAASLKMGAIIAKADKDNAQNIYNFGLNLGIAFQLQDDYLDVYASADFGKQQAGDIIENKKTYLYLKALEEASESDKDLLIKIYQEAINPSEKVTIVKDLYAKYNIPTLVKKEIEFYTQKSLLNLNSLSISDSKKDILRDFSNNLMCRTT